MTGIRNQDLANEKHFPDVAQMLNEWLVSQLGDISTGVLVAHNAATDVQFLCCEYQRSGMSLPPQINLVLDTMKCLKRFASLVYRKVAKEDWPQLTDKGALSMGVKPCAIYALRHRDPPETFAVACGEHHDADADTRAVAVVLFDQKQFGSQGLWHLVFKTHKKNFQPLSEVWNAMKIKMSQPVFNLEPPPNGWVPAEVFTMTLFVATHILSHTLKHTHLFTG